MSSYVYKMLIFVKCNFHCHSSPQAFYFKNKEQNKKVTQFELFKNYSGSSAF